jgi:hypothetical protein
MWFINEQLNPPLNGNIKHSSHCAFKRPLCVRLDAAARPGIDLPHLSPPDSLNVCQPFADSLNRSALPHALKKGGKTKLVVCCLCLLFI